MPLEALAGWTPNRPGPREQRIAGTALPTGFPDFNERAPQSPSAAAWCVMKLLALIVILLIPPGALACELALVAPAKSALKKPVQARALLADDILTAGFSVSAPSLNARKVLDPQKHPYDYDVVELFLTFSKTGFPYYEFEVSPFNQTFQVTIVSHTRHQEGVDLGLVSSATILPHGWSAELKIPLKSLGWDGDPGTIRGNFYSILGRAPRSYWSSFLPRAKAANFHQPQFFQLLLPCE
jgi:hypothetical protein